MSGGYQTDMLKIGKLDPQGFSCNCYFLTADDQNFIAIDPGQLRFFEETKKGGMIFPYVLLTHGHFDHIRGCAALQAAGAKIGCLEGEEEIALHNNLGEVYGDGPVPPFRIDFTFREGDRLDLCGISFDVIASPGHSKGGACFLVKAENHPLYQPGILFTGDTLFAGSVGRTDGPTGSDAELQKSLKKLCSLKENYKILPGHGPCSTLFEERRTNGYLQW